MTQITNFGGNIHFRPRRLFEPETEDELLTLLRLHRSGCIRVIGARHSWSDVIVSNDTVIDMRKFCNVAVAEVADGFQVTVGAGCRIKDLLAALNQQGLTLPALGLITEQSIAGAIATGTHGSGRHSLSHYIQQIRIACFPDGNDEPRIVDLRGGSNEAEIDLQAARCSLGCLGVVVSVTLPCVAQYNVVEQAAFGDSVEEMLAFEARSPLQQFFLVPHRWSYMAQERAAATEPRGGWAGLYRVYWYCLIDIGLHLAIKLAAAWLRSRLLVRFFFRRLVLSLIFPRWRVVDRSDRMLVMEHELFRHLELEAFVPAGQIVPAARFVELVLKQAAGESVSVPAEVEQQLRDAELWNDFNALAGRYLHHYPVCFRKVLRDNTLLSMASGEDHAWYAISFITYVQSRDRFYEMATFLARSLRVLHRGRIHWGKWFPLDAAAVEQMYPQRDQFLAVCRRFDPQGVFANEFVRRTLRTDLAPLPPENGPRQ